MIIMTSMRMLRHDAGGGRETTLSFGVALAYGSAYALLWPLRLLI